MPGQRQKGKRNVRKTKYVNELIEPSKSQLICKIETCHGGYPARFSCKTLNDDIIIAPIQGSISKGPRRVMIKKGDYVLLDLIEFISSGESYYIHHVYTKNDVKELEKKGLLNKTVNKDSSKTDTSLIFGEQDKVSDVGESDDLNIEDI